MQDATQVTMRVVERGRLARQNDAGEYFEFVVYGTDRETTTITPDSDPEEFARLVALEQAGADAD